MCIHGDKAQPERDWVLQEFRAGKAPILCATDVASRGLGTKQAPHVCTVPCPYVHGVCMSVCVCVSYECDGILDRTSMKWGKFWLWALVCREELLALLFFVWVCGSCVCRTDCHIYGMEGAKNKDSETMRMRLCLHAHTHE